VSAAPPLGAPVPGWTVRPWPAATPMQGRFVRVEALRPAHSDQLFAANAEDREGRNWAYLPYGPFAEPEAYRRWVADAASKPDPQFYVIIDLASGRPVGVASLMRMDPANGVIEVGHINYAPPLQRHPGGTEAMYLMMARAFDELGNRRYEWKCHALNQPSRRAAERLGFTFEGIFRQANVVKGRNRDTAWYSVIDGEWPGVKAAFEAWLAPENFDRDGRQRRSLTELRAAR